MIRAIIISLFFLLSLPAFAQYNIKKMMEEGRSQLSQGYYVTALQLFQRVVSVKHNLYEPYFLMAKAKYHLEDYQGAEEDCANALRLQPYIADIFDLYGMVLIKEQKFDRAIKAYTKAIDIDKTNQNYWYNRAYCFYQMGDNKNAKDQLSYILKHWPRLYEARRLQADIRAGVKPKVYSKLPENTPLPPLKLQKTDVHTFVLGK